MIYPKSDWRTDVYQRDQKNVTKRSRGAEAIIGTLRMKAVHAKKEKSSIAFIPGYVKASLVHVQGNRVKAGKARALPSTRQGPTVLGTNF